MSQGFNAFDDRRQALEEGYFHTRDSETIDKLKKVFQAKMDKEHLRASTGIANDEVLDRLIRLNVRGQLLTAFKLYPLAELAWADGSLEQAEADAVLSAARKLGLAPGSEAMERFSEWLKNGPTPDGRAAWKMLAAELCKVLTPAELAAFRKDLLDQAKLVAEASGGILGTFLAVSGKEKQVIDAISRALTHG